MTRRVQRDPNVPLDPGLYELVATVRHGNPHIANRAQLEAALQLTYGPRITVSDYTVRGDRLVVRFEVRLGPGLQPAALWLPIALTGAAVLAALWLVWRIAAELVEFVELVRVTPSVQVGIVAAAVAVAALTWRAIAPRKGSG